MWWLFDFSGILKYGPLRNLLGYLEKAFPCIYMPTRNQLKSFGGHRNTTHVCQPILNQRPKIHYKFQSENFHLTHPCFELCRNNSEQVTPRMCANPEPRFQRYTTKPQTLRKTPKKKNLQNSIAAGKYPIHAVKHA